MIAQIIGQCLIETLQDGLKEDFTPKTKKAWIKIFGVVESHMKVGMRKAESEKAASKAKCPVSDINGSSLNQQKKNTDQNNNNIDSQTGRENNEANENNSLNQNKSSVKVDT
jgi:hypothetical protein